MNEKTIACIDAIGNKERAVRNEARWEAMVQSIGWSLTVATIATVILLFWGNDTSKLVAGASAIAAGGGLVFVVKQRNRANLATAKASGELRTQCGPRNTDGHLGVLPERGVLPPEVIDALTREQVLANKTTVPGDPA